MASSISTSRSTRQSVISLSFSVVVLILAVAAAWVYIREVDPEVRFWTKVVETRFAEAAAVPTEQPRFLFIGGSSCAFSVDAHDLEQKFGIQTVNLGVHAGAGRGFQLELALQMLRVGDFLIVAFETPLWRQTEPIKAEPLGSKLWYGYLKPTGTGQSLLTDLEIDAPYSSTHLRPGGFHCVTLLSKLMLRRDLYRYHLSDIHEFRRLTTDYKASLLLPVPAIDRGELSEYNRGFLKRLSKYVENRGGTMAVSLPWQLIQDDLLEEQRDLNRELAKEISGICLCLDDPALGAQSDVNLYSDTVWHLSAEGSEQRNQVLGSSLRMIHHTGDL